MKINLDKKEIWDIYPEVYHYTKFSTALLIINSGILRATRFDLLNDTQEINYSKEIIVPKLLERFKGATTEDARHDLDIFYKAMGNDLYIISFCGKDSKLDHTHHDNGLLSMWRSYGTDGGCAITFKTKNIYDQTIKYRHSIEISSALVMDEAIYEGHNDSDSEYRNRLDRFANNALDLLPNPKDIEPQRRRELYEDFLCLMICSKHPAFFEEREVRIGLCFNKGIQEIKNPSTPPPDRHEIPFSPAQDISRIIIGPHSDQKQRFDFLKSYFDKYDLNIDITMSEIPLR